MSSPIRVALVDDEQMVREGLAAWLTRADPSVRVEIASGSWLELLTHPRFPVDVVLLDLDLRDTTPPEAKVATLRAAGVPCVIVSTHADAERVRSCITAGARGYLPKSESPVEMILALRAVVAGDSYLSPALASLLAGGSGRRTDAPRLSPQELRALTLYACGLPMKSVALRLHVSYETAKGYVDQVRQKYRLAGREARTKVELYRRAVEDGYISASEDRPADVWQDRRD